MLALRLLAVEAKEGLLTEAVDVKGGTPADSTATPAEDDSAFRPASEFIADERFPTYKDIRKALDANPWIRCKKPTGKNGKPVKNRLNIHAGDWHKFLNQPQANQPQAIDLMDQNAAAVDALMETQKRKAEVRIPSLFKPHIILRIVRRGTQWIAMHWDKRDDKLMPFAGLPMAVTLKYHEGPDPKSVQVTLNLPWVTG
jgi:hypothetical protein